MRAAGMSDKSKCGKSSGATAARAAPSRTWRIGLMKGFAPQAVQGVPHQRDRDRREPVRIFQESRESRAPYSNISLERGGFAITKSRAIAAKNSSPTNRSIDGKICGQRVDQADCHIVAVDSIAAWVVEPVNEVRKPGAGLSGSSKRRGKYAVQRAAQLLASSAMTAAEQWLGCDFVENGVGCRHFGYKNRPLLERHCPILSRLAPARSWPA